MLTGVSVTLALIGIAMALWAKADLRKARKLGSFEGPVYADRVNHRLTFFDWDHWTKEDQDKWRDDPRAPKAD